MGLKVVCIYDDHRLEGSSLLLYLGETGSKSRLNSSGSKFGMTSFWDRGSQERKRQKYKHMRILDWIDPNWSTNQKSRSKRMKHSNDLLKL